MLWLPKALIVSRAVIAVVIAAITYFHVNQAGLLIAALAFIGLLTDVFDGIVARRLGVATQELRSWDSNVDQFFWIVLLICTFILRQELVQEHFLWIGIILLLEVLAYLICYYRFRKPIATHTILAKVWTISLLIYMLELLLFNSNYSFWICFALGFISRIEIIWIMMRLNNWATDIPSFKNVDDINKGLEIKRNKWFN